MYEIKQDCKFYDKERNACKALKDLYCAFEKECSFYQSKMPFKEAKDELLTE